MITRLIEWSARNPVLVILGVLLLTAGGVWAVFEVPLDAIPDLSDVQAIVFTEWSGRSPTLIEDQITYPIVTSLLAAPGVKRVRGVSEYGFSYVYVIFQDHIDLYWARSRVWEYMQKLTGKLPVGVTPTLGPDATGVGWVYQYAWWMSPGRTISRSSGASRTGTSATSWRAFLAWLKWRRSAGSSSSIRSKWTPTRSRRIGCPSRQ